MITEVEFDQTADEGVVITSEVAGAPVDRMLVLLIAVPGPLIPVALVDDSNPVGIAVVAYGVPLMQV